MRGYLLFLLFFLFPIVTLAAPNPFTAPVKKGSNSHIRTAPQITTNSQFSLTGSLNSLQHTLRSRLVGGNLLVLAFFAFLYGVVHALSPGHGKSILAAWIVSSRQEAKQVFKVTLLGTLLHIGSAVVIVSGSWFLLNSALDMNVETVKYYLHFAVALLLVLIGIKELLHIKKNNHYIHRSKSNSECYEKRKNGIVALSVGMIPCPVSSMLLLHAITNKMFVRGLLLVALFAGGLLLSLILFVGLVWYINKKTTHFFKSRAAKLIQLYLPAAGALLLIGLGVYSFFTVL